MKVFLKPCNLDVLYKWMIVLLGYAMCFQSVYVRNDRQVNFTPNSVALANNGYGLKCLLRFYKIIKLFHFCDQHKNEKKKTQYKLMYLKK